MKIYAYYSPLQVSSEPQLSLINLWKQSWSKKGFDAKVLYPEDAAAHPYFSEYISVVQRLHLEITGKAISEYGLACYMRWLAYATLEEKPIFVSDYDLVNVDFSLDDAKDAVGELKELTFLHGCCPCLACGTPKQFLNFCKSIVEITQTHKTEIAAQVLSRNFVHFHDQDFLILNSQRLKCAMYPVRSWVWPYEYSYRNKKLIHVSNKYKKEQTKSKIMLELVSGGLE